MSITVLALAKSFTAGKLSADQFSDAYIEIWKFERDRELLQKDDVKLSECLSSIFCLADLYNPKSSRKEYELNGEQLKEKVSLLITDLGL